MHCIINFNMDNSAFENNEEREAARILEHIADQIKRMEVHGKCVDINGNTIGKWDILNLCSKEV